MGFNYVIEHMEEDEETSKAIPPWVELEYAHMRTLAGPYSQVHFTHLSKASSDSLDAAFAKSDTEAAASSGKAKAICHSAGVLELMKERGVPLSKVCLLDPKAEKVLSPEDGDGEFEWFLFGGILGDDPPRDRTSELRVLGFPNRHLGPVQMTTDTALGVTKLVVQDKKRLDEIPYVEFPTIHFNSKESVEMPFRYIANGSEPLLPPGMKELLHEDLNKSFDF
ncbi:hypothetical protein EST38_g10548 [Candolleomyces aberdarensis]|uniref:DUF431-domain-containing protein n=1 Tax=Candolleomyces aberdarensis TaxID=2316362 RepID=A0A4Q2D9I9_9AGAR|nr:hypothetical protein EST38_g10548 [Candolleomyces aberdarensis]